MRALAVLFALTLACARSELETASLLATDTGGSASNQGSGGTTSNHAMTNAGSGGARPCAWELAPLVTYPGGPAPSTVAVGDLDGDGHADVVVNNYGTEADDRVQILHNQGDGTLVVGASFQTTVGFSMAIGPFVTSRGDLLVGCDLFANQGDGTFGPAIRYGTGCGDQDSWHNLATADFNGDGKLDFAWGLSNDAVVVLNQSNGPFLEVPTPLSPNTLHVTTLTSADFDRDGRADLAAACWGYGNPNLLVLLHGNGDGTFEVSATDTGTSMLKSITAGDLDGNGSPDLVTTANGSVEVRLQQADGSFGAPVTYPEYLGNPGTLLGDLNGDGAMDIVLADENGLGLSYFLNAGDGTFGKQTFLQGVGSLWNAALGDLNADGRLDIVGASAFAQPGGEAEVWLSHCK
jgi:hypothetical protein